MTRLYVEPEAEEELEEAAARYEEAVPDLGQQFLAEMRRRVRDVLEGPMHADRGSSMTSKSVALLLADLGVTKTHLRPYVSNDNPFSESTFKTLKYRPDFPDRFGCIADSRGHSGRLIDWYNLDHCHGALGLCTPYEMHHGLAVATIARPRRRPRRRLARASRALLSRTAGRPTFGSTPAPQVATNSARQ